MAKRNLPSEPDILKAIYAAVRHEDQTRMSRHKKPEKKGVYAFFTPIKAFIELPLSCEVEARFGTFRATGFEPGVSPAVFAKVQGEIRRLTSLEPVTTQTLIEIIKGVRKILNLKTSTLTFQRKTSFRSDYVDLKTLGVRIGASLEEPVQSNEFDAKSPPEISRTRLRTTFKPWKGVQVDFTEVSEKKPWESVERKKYEIEIERISGCTTSGFIDAVSAVAEWIRQTAKRTPNWGREQKAAAAVPGRSAQRPKDGGVSRSGLRRSGAPTPPVREEETSEQVIRVFNGLFNVKSSTKFANFFVNRPISIKYKNLLEVTADNSAWDTTIKLDGVRKFLFITSFGSFLCDLFSHRFSKVGKGCAELHGTIIDGEYLEKEAEEKGNPPSFYAFDILFNKRQDVRTESFTQRKHIFQADRFVQDVRVCLDSPILSFYSKKFYSLADFYGNVRNALKDTRTYHTQSVGTDGLIFQPALQAYSNMNTWKWKPPDLLSIDFYFEVRQKDTYALLVGAGRYRKKVLFTGDRDFPYSNPGVVVEGGMLNGVSVAEKTVECFYRNGEFVPFRVRKDKPFPNSITTAQSVWRDINNPISQDTIKGYTLKLFRRVSNLQKKTLLNTYVPKGQTLLDIGSGRGGDLHKWNQNQYSVYAVEPDEFHRTEFARRRQTMASRTPQNQVTLINTVIEDTQTIADVVGGGRIDSVVAFFSLTYLTKNKQTWTDFLRSINRFVPTGGIFVGTVLDGLKTRLLLSKSQGIVNNPTFTIKQKYQSESPSFLGDDIFLDIKDPDSLVKDQTEYLFYFDFFKEALEQLGFTLIQTHFFSDLEAYRSLPSDSKLYSTLMRSFVFQRKKSCVDPFINKLSMCLASLFSKAPAEELGRESAPAEELGGKSAPAEELGGKSAPAEELGGKSAPAEEKCPDCDLTFPDKTDVDKHRTQRHPFRCSECSRTFQRKSSLTKHAQKHTQEEKKDSSYRYRYAITFSKNGEEGFPCSELDEIAKQINEADPDRASVVNITAPLFQPENYQAWANSLRKRYKKKKTPFIDPPKDNLPKACLLVIKNGIELLIKPDEAAKLYQEQDEIRYDGRFFDKGRLKIKRAHKNMLFAAERQDASDDYTQATVTAFSEVPLLNKIRTSIQSLLGDRTADLEVDGTKYHTSFYEKGDDGKPMKKHSNMGWHGDDNKKIVVGMCLGASATLSFIWRLPGSQKNSTDTRVTVPLAHGDVYVMSEKTIGSDWKSSSLLRCLHSVDLSDARPAS